MSKQAIVFPGQGSQKVGMGKALYEAFPVAKEVFKEVDDALKIHLSRIMFDGPQDKLTLTEHAQPAIMAVSMAALAVAKQELGWDIKKKAAYVAGHSLGEYSALCAAGTLSLSDTARLLKIRGQAMQRAVPTGIGAMAAILGLKREMVEIIAGTASQDEICAVANDNAPGQVVVSGAAGAVQRAIEVAKEKGAKRALLLEVSAPFHCPLMAPAAGVMQDALAQVEMRAPVVPVITNITAGPETDPVALRRLLVDQVTDVVRWRESMEYLATHGVDSIIEMGAGKVLCGLVKRIAPTIVTTSLGEPKDFEVFAEAA